MERLTDKAHRILASHLRAGDIAIDATAGNGHDTVFLAKSVGPKGYVFAFDTQPQALENTKKRVTESSLENVQLISACHSQMETQIAPKHHGQIAAVTFNLGYLPGSGKTVTTKTETTIAAIQSGLSLLKPGGVVTIVAYTGHPGGKEEAEAIETIFQVLPISTFDLSIESPDIPNSPKLYTAKRKTEN